MTVVMRDRDIGCISAAKTEEGFEIRIFGQVGSQAVVDALRKTRELENLADRDTSGVEDIIERMKRGLKKLDRYLTQGGIISQQGKLRFFNNFSGGGEGDLVKVGCAVSTAAVFLGDKAANSGFSPHENLYLAAPLLGERLTAYTHKTMVLAKANPVAHFTVRGEPRGYMSGMIQGFSHVVENSLVTEPVLPIAVNARQMVMQRIYDYSRKQVPVLERM